MLSRLLTAAATAVALIIACASDEKASLSQRGEGCERHADCGSGLACVAGVCAEGSFNVPPTGNECVRIECEEDSDCCEESSTCLMYRERCADGETLACDQVDVYCICNASCEDNRCSTTCDEDNPCPVGFCESGECVECQCDAHCDAGEVCKDARCRPQCSRDADCPRFHRCEDSECVDVGCANDRECVAHLQNVLAFCDGGECRERCSSDIECGNAESFGFRACVEGTCRDVGCESDEECRAYLSRQSGWTGLAECRPRTEPRPEGVAGVGGDDCPTPTTCDNSCAFAFDGFCDEPGSCAPGTDCNDCQCGNGRVDSSEDCDGTNFGGETCETWTGISGSTGTLVCTSACTISASGCSGGVSICGDGIVNGVTEECDGTNLNGETCNSATSGLSPNGTLFCDYNCQFDTSACSASAICGNGVAEGTEDCDGADVNGETCSSATSGALPVGTLTCGSFCSFDTSGCSASAVCGNGVVEGTEECDSTNLNGETCSSATAGVLTQGTLSCSACTLVTSGCHSCGDGTLDSGEECDTTVPVTNTCSTETGGVFTSGSLSCTTSCTIDSSACVRSCDTCGFGFANDGFCDEGMAGLCGAGTDCSDCCDDSCATANNGVCEEGSTCAAATDCTDCGG